METKRYELIESEWSRIKDMLLTECLKEGERGCPAKCANRRVMNEILWIIRGGTPWKERPERYGLWWIWANKEGRRELLLPASLVSIMPPFEIECFSPGPEAPGPEISMCQTHRPARPAPGGAPARSAVYAPPSPGSSAPSAP